jgi:hypothetical protein
MTPAQKETRRNLIKRWLAADIYYYYSDDHSVYTKGRYEIDLLRKDCEATGNADLIRIPQEDMRQFHFVLQDELSKL